MESIDPGDLIRGSTEIRAWPDTILVALPGDDQQEVVIHHIKARWSERLPPFKVRMQIDSETEKATLVYTGDVEPDDRTSAGSQNRILRAIVGLWEAGEDTDAEALSAIVGRSPRTVREHLKVMVGVGAVDAIEKHEPGKRPKLIYRIKGA
jgi:DNA-binding transcriptional ArsR family regulator